MDTEVDSSPYDAVAGLYHAMWADWYLPAARPALENLFFSKVTAGSRVLDLCCGCGHITRELVRRGYQLIGVDSSAALIALARRELPEVDFRIADARALTLEREFDGVLSTFDSLNHVLSLSELRQVFTGVRRVLSPGGLLLFDMNLEEAYLMDLREWTVHVDEASVGLVRGTYDIGTKLATTELIWFVRGGDGLWRQHRSSVAQRCYTQQEILVALAEAGFTRMEAINAQEAGMRSDLAFGRVYLAARR